MRSDGRYACYRPGRFCSHPAKIPVILENTQVFNSLYILHGCYNARHTAERSRGWAKRDISDGVDSIIAVNGVVTNQPLTAFVQNWGNLNQKIQSKDIFPQEAQKNDALGNVIGWWEELAVCREPIRVSIPS